MEVISTRGRGPQTIYTVKQGDRVWTMDRASLPTDVFQRWRNHQAAECMRRKRAKDKPDQPVEGESAQIEPQTDQQEERQPLDLRASQEAETSGNQQAADETGQRAIDLITCKVCQDREVQKMIIPCGHLIFCGPCLTMAMSQKNVCPICRTEIKDHFGVIMIQ